MSDMHDYILVLARNKESLSLNSWQLSEKQLAAYKNPDKDPRGNWRAQDLSASKPYSAGQFAITGPTGKVFLPPPNRYWRCNEDQFVKWVDDDRIWWGVNKDARPMLKAFLSESDNGITPHTWWSYDFAGHNKEATLEMKNLFDGSSPFDTPKPVKLMMRMLELVCSEDSIVMDFFAGSAPLADAVMRFSSSANAKVNYILAQLPEPTENGAYETISDIGKERIRRAAQKVREEREGQLDLEGKDDLDFGFKVLKLDQSNFKPWQAPSEELSADQFSQQLALHTDHIDPEASQEDILYELLIKAGFMPTEKIETLVLAGKQVFSIAEGALLICLEDQLTGELIDAVADLEPMQFICLDKGFKGNDQLKANAVQTFKSRSQGAETEMVFKVV
jgi:adenine-specific DNA-methyltransferase